MTTETIDTIIEANIKDLGDGVIIKRLLPYIHRTIGPYVFFDYIPNVHFKEGTGLDVRPHPHIGLSTLTYLVKGRNHHKDSIDNDIIVGSGDVLLMTSGNGIVHSERTPVEDRFEDHSLHGFQFWLALPVAQEEIDPLIMFAKNSELPLIDLNENLKGQLAIGEFNGVKSPVYSFLAPVLVDINTTDTNSFEFETKDQELAIFLDHGEVTIDNKVFNTHQIIAFKKNVKVKVEYQSNSHFIIFGGDSLDGHRHIWWNLVSSDQNKIEEAKLRWKNGKFAGVPGDTEFIPLPNQ